MFNGIGEAAYIVETNTGRILACNDQAAAQTGYSKDELVGMNILDDLSVTPPDVGIDALADKLARGERARFTHQKRRKDGTVYWEEVIVTPLRANGEPIHISLDRDITDQIEGATKVRESEELYRTLFGKLSDALFLETLDGKIIEVNESACELLGYSHEELIQMSVNDLIPSEEKRFHPKLIDEKTRKGKALETVNLRKDGTAVPVELRGRIVKLHGKPRILVSLRDISDRIRTRRVERVLRRISEAATLSEGLTALFAQIREILGTVMDTTNFSIALYDPATDIITTPYMVDEKDSFRTFVAGNTPTAHVIKSGHPLLITPANREEITRKLGIKSVGVQAQAWLGVPLHREEQVIGAVVVQSYTNPNQYNEEDVALLETVSGHIGLAITKKQAQDALRESEARYRSIFSATSDGIIVFTQDGTIVEANPAAYQMYGYEEGEMIGLSAEQIVHPDYYHGFKNFKQGANSGVFISDSVNLRKDGTSFPVEVYGIRFIFRGEPHLLSVTRDISARVAAEQALHAAREKIERLHEIAHQLEQSKTEDEVYRITVESADKILSFSLCTLDIVEGDELVTKATSAGLPAGASRSTPLSEETLATKTYHTKKTYVIGSPDEDSSARPTRPEFQSGISAPIGEFGVFQVAATEKNAFSEEDVRLLELLLGHTAQAIARIRMQNELKEQAIRDPLTGVYNRRYFNEVIERELVRAKRYSHPIGFLMIDVDGFKRINDRFGHQMGDKILQAVADLLVAQVRETDLVVRYGGDEFLVMLIETNGQAKTVKQRIQSAVAQRNKTNVLIPEPVTLSIGTAHWDPASAEPIEHILAEADRQMYEQKRS